MGQAFEFHRRQRLLDQLGERLQRKPLFPHDGAKLIQRGKDAVPHLSALARARALVLRDQALLFPLALAIGVDGLQELEQRRELLPQRLGRAQSRLQGLYGRKKRFPHTFQRRVAHRPLEAVAAQAVRYDKIHKPVSRLLRNVHIARAHQVDHVLRAIPARKQPQRAGERAPQRMLARAARIGKRKRHAIQRKRAHERQAARLRVRTHNQHFPVAPALGAGQFPAQAGHGHGLRVGIGAGHQPHPLGRARIRARRTAEQFARQVGDFRVLPVFLLRPHKAALQTFRAHPRVQPLHRAPRGQKHVRVARALVPIQRAKHGHLLAFARHGGDQFLKQRRNQIEPIEAHRALAQKRRVREARNGLAQFALAILVAARQNLVVSFHQQGQIAQLMPRRAALHCVRATAQRGAVQARLLEELHLLERALRKPAPVKRVLIPHQFTRARAGRPVQRHGAALLVDAFAFRRARFLKNARQKAGCGTDLQAKRALDAQRVEKGDLRFQRQLAGHQNDQLPIQQNGLARATRERGKHRARAPHNVFHRHLPVTLSRSPLGLCPSDLLLASYYTPFAPKAQAKISRHAAFLAHTRHSLSAIHDCFSRNRQLKLTF